MPAFLAIPLGYWAVGAIGTALGVGATVVATDSVEDFGQAAEKTTNLVNSVSKAALIAGVGYVAWANRDLIASAAKKVLK